MHFCTNCGNMYYIRLSSEGESQLIYYCRKCGHEDTTISNTTLVVSKTNIKEGEQSFHHIINRFTKLDPTLPHITSLKCPNASCICNTDDTLECDFIYMRYDDTNMKYIYMCTHCDIIWNNDTN